MPPPYLSPPPPGRNPGFSGFRRLLRGRSAFTLLCVVLGLGLGSVSGCAGGAGAGAGPGSTEPGSTLAALAPAPAPALAPDPILAAAIQRDLASSAATGAVLVAVDVEGVRQVEGVGFVDLAGELPMPSGHLAHLGSWGEVLLASMALRLEEAGTLELSDPARTWAPELPPRIGQATLEHLLLEAGGFDASPLVWRLPGEEVPRLPPDSLLALLRDPVVQSPSGIVRSPSPHHGLLASHLVERAAGVSLDALLEEWIVRPLGLESTVSALPGMAPAGAHPGHQLARGADGPYTLAPFLEPAVLLPQERIWTSGHDLGRIVASWLLDPDHLVALARPRMAEPGAPEGTQGHALGFRIDGNHRWVARGQAPGYTVVLHLYPARGRAYLALANGSASGMPRTLDRMAEADEARDPEGSTGRSSTPLAALEAMPIPPLGLEPVERVEAAMAGTYRNGSEIFRLVAGPDGALAADMGLATPLPLRAAEGGVTEAFVGDGRTAVSFRIFRDGEGGLMILKDGLVFRLDSGAP